MGLVKHVLSYWYPQLRESIENPAHPLSAIFEDRKTASGQNVTEEKALAIGAVYACVKVISETMAQMDLEVVEKVGKYTRPNTSHANYWLQYSTVNTHSVHFVPRFNVALNQIVKVELT